MPVLDDLGKFLQDNGFGVLGTSIFLGSVPQDAPGAGVQDQILALLEAPGMPPEHVHDILGPAVEQARIQCRWRGSPHGYETARGMAGAAFTLLDSVINQTINGVFYRRIMALEGPFALPPDEWQRPIVLFEILCQKDPA